MHPRLPPQLPSELVTLPTPQATSLTPSATPSLTPPHASPVTPPSPSPFPQADAEGVRASCGTLFLVFLLNYPLGPKRLQQNLDFLALNLAYEVPHGRASLLALMKQAEL